MNSELVAFLVVCLLGFAVHLSDGKAVNNENISPGATENLKTDQEETDRSAKQKRSYFGAPASSQNYISVFDASQVWRPATYTISRPYVIPVYSISNRYPIFYPPQPVYTNPGAPVDNPLKPPFKAPGYLPPQVTSKPNTMDVGNRFGEDDDNDAPIWGGGDMVGLPLSGNDEKETGVIPTRAPSPPQSLPPLIHNIQQVRTTTTTTPPPPAVIAGPSNCVWAIVSCCSASTPEDYSANCFEQRGCPGPFWGRSPCESDFARAAIAAAVKYYGNSGK